MPSRSDALLALGLLVGVMAEQAIVLDLDSADLLFVPGCAALAWRRMAPVGSCLAAVVLLGAPEFLDAGSTDAFTVFVGIIVALYSLAAHGARERLVAAAAVSSAVVAAVAAEAGLNDPEYSDSLQAVTGGVFFALFVVCAPPLAIGVGVRRQAAMRRRLEEQAGELERERERHGDAAAAQERARMAGELHAVTAEGVRTMLGELAVARVCATDDPERAASALLRVEQRGRDALTEMRGLLGVLRRGDEDLALAPQPSLARLDALAGHLAGAGLDVSLRVEGAPRQLTPGLDLAAYRVVEEALATASGATHAEVIVRWADRDLELEVGVDAPVLADPGVLAATRERVTLFGGSLDAGRRPHGGSAMRAALPAEGAS